jgi:copper(I)-binding protein
MRFLAAALVFAIAACSQPAEAPPQLSADAIEIENARAAPTPGGVDVAAGYLTIVNSGTESDTLLAASSPRAARVEVHEMTMPDGVMQMRPVERLDIAPGQSLELRPGGRHLMFMGVTQPFVEGETIPLQLRFEHAGALDVSLPVQGPGADHAEH